MRAVAIAALLTCVIHSAATAQSRQSPATTSSAPDRVAQAYDQFMVALHLEEKDDVDGAIAGLKHAMELDPQAAEIPAELAALYMRQNRAEDAIQSAEQALKISPTNREANRGLGLVYTAMAEMGRQTGVRARADKGDSYVALAIQHLEVATANAPGDPDPNIRAALARMYVRASQYDKAIPLLRQLVDQEPGWAEGPVLLAEAYAASGRNGEAIQWLEDAAPSDPLLYSTLANFYEREQRWKDAATAYSHALEQQPRNTMLRTRYAAALLNGGTRDDFTKARDVLTGVLASKPNDGQALYLLSQAQRRLGDGQAAEASARQLIQRDAKSPWGYYALAEILEERHDYQGVVGALAAPIDGYRASAGSGATGAGTMELGLLLPHLGFAYQELKQYDKAIATFEEDVRRSPNDPAAAGYLAQAYIAAKKYDKAIATAEQGRAGRPGELRLARLQAQALRLDGKTDQAVALLESVLKQRTDDPAAYAALAQLYSDADRGDQAIKILEDAKTKFPSDDTVTFELGAVLDKQKRFADAEATFRQIIARDPENAAALNYLGYMLADRGERLEESVGYLKKALQLDPDNGSYLDSLGWAYYKSDQLQLAETNLKRAAEQLTTNSVVQDHWGDLLFKLGRMGEAIDAWNRALNGDGEEIHRNDVEKKIKTAKQKLDRK